MIKNIILCIIAAAFILSAFYIGMSCELCRRDLSPADYHSMKLDCKSWIYR